MMQTADCRHGNDLRSHDGVHLGSSLSRGLFLQAEMRSVLVIVADTLTHEPFQVALVEHDDMVKQIAPTTAHKSLSNSILRRALEACSLGLCAEALSGLDHFFV